MSAADATSFNLADHFIGRHLREGRGHKVAIRCGESSYTYAALAGDINRAGNGLLRLGLQQKQRVLLMLPDCPEFAIAYFATIKIGAVAVRPVTPHEPPTTTTSAKAEPAYHRPFHALAQ
jgi:acyl-coenzyme A synthetase/AMP-(fatty) acid ligase